MLTEPHLEMNVHIYAISKYVAFLKSIVFIYHVRFVKFVEELLASKRIMSKDLADQKKKRSKQTDPANPLD